MKKLLVTPNKVLGPNYLTNFCSRLAVTVLTIYILLPAHLYAQPSTNLKIEEKLQKSVVSPSVKTPDDPNVDLIGKTQDYKQDLSKLRRSKYLYTYIDRRHSFAETMKHIGIVYGISWVIYPLTQPSVVRDKGSFDNYKLNFGHIVFDKDEPFWNWFVHPISGSQLFLYYRANGYTRVNSLALAFVSSTLFEFTIEIYTEPASVQDLYQTPILGSVLGVVLENFSLYLLNTGNTFGKFFGHLLNPSTLFDFYEGRIFLQPTFNQHGINGLVFSADF